MRCEENVSESIGSSGRLKRLQGAEVSFTCFMFDTHLFIKDESGSVSCWVTWDLGSDDERRTRLLTNKLFHTKLID